MADGGAAQGNRAHPDPAPELGMLPDRVCLWCQAYVDDTAYMMAFGTPQVPSEVFVLHVNCEREMRVALAHVGAAQMNRYPL